MKKNLDIYLGLLAWVIALAAIWLEFFVSVPHELEIKDKVLPSLWICTVLAMVIFQKRPLRKLWWVWPSFPFAFLFWLGGLLMFIAWSTGGFAP